MPCVCFRARGWRSVDRNNFIIFHEIHPELAHLRFRRVSGFPNHVIFYFVHADAIEVLRILHGAQDLDAV